MKEHDKGISDFSNPVRTRTKPQLNGDMKL